ncbi:DNA-directed RNA polymerase, alpha subunit/40 kD subunit [Caldisphaera lagunensis DSM 15908]|uniref:DNA-directed RNA polymerase subunit Rpo3 n=1 Tax=Caldisphaera lagunensis (strain DSM 15908 / JCM 11604 / ANMR 0165 / IC-154) TaxID=1056495 RepID=L0A8X7_CALLD|nr:DNA-directed RNA polymerase subunit D [Caldisphaera lagunensis]AFZ70311.1 DNA-directed RNA polymerase, alpha subunit/40 kD subunit [Caldisphaera lagunensis DSM 15908]
MEKSVDILDFNNNRITVYLEGFPIAFGNALRRLVLSDVPTMAVDYVYFYDNDTSVYDEIIAHRLGLLVLKSDDAIHKYGLPENCAGKSETDTNCYTQIVLEKELSNDSGSGIYVKASDLKFSDASIKPAYPDTPIVYLAPGQRIHLVAYARLGRGKEHGKWSPASASVLQYTTLVDINGEKATDECIECVSYYKEVANSLKARENTTIEYKTNINTSGLRYCEESSCKDIIKVRYDSSRLLLTVESNGSLEPQQIILEASNSLDRRVEELLEKIEKVSNA